MKRNKKLIFSMVITVILLVANLAGCGKKSVNETVTLYAWGGDKRVNDWIDDTFAPYV